MPVNKNGIVLSEKPSLTTLLPLSLRVKEIVQCRWFYLKGPIFLPLKLLVVGSVF